MDFKIPITSMLIFYVVTFLFSLADDTAQRVRVRFLFSTIFYFIVLVTYNILKLGG